jgi:hypothetical protein
MGRSKRERDPAEKVAADLVKEIAAKAGVLILRGDKRT